MFSSSHSGRAEIPGALITCRPSRRTAMWATCPLCREPVVPLGSAARATCLSNQNGRKGTARSGRPMSTPGDSELYLFKLCYQDWTNPLPHSCEPVFPSAVCCHVQTFSAVKNVCTWSDSGRKMQLSCHFLLWRVQIWLRLVKSGTKWLNSAPSSWGGGCLSISGNTHTDVTHFISLGVASYKSIKKFVCMALLYCKSAFLFISVIWNQSASDLGCTVCVCLSMFVDNLHALFGFLSALHVLHLSLLSPSSASCDRGASHERGTSI